MAGGYTREGRRVSFPIQGTINFGEPRNQAPYSEKVQRVAELLDRCSIPYQIPEDMIKAMWWKFMINTSINQLSAILDGAYGLFQEQGPARALMVDAMEELRCLANLKGIKLNQEDIDLWLNVLDTKNQPGGTTSMLQDFRNRRPMEFRSFGGVALKMAEEYKLQMPLTQAIYRIMESLEQRIAQGENNG